MKRIYITSLYLLLVIVSSCGPKIYQSSRFDEALTRHKIVAILPANVVTRLRPNEAKKVTPEQIEEINKQTGYDIQERMYSWFLRRSDKFHYTVTFQDITRTNALLKEAGVEYRDLASRDRTELAKILKVDAVLQNYSNMEKPMSEGVALASGILLGVWGNTNQVNTTINIHDGTSGDLLWKYDYVATGTVGSSSTNLVNALMRNASKKFPYNAK